MNDFKVMLNKQQQQYLARLLPKGYSFELYKVRKNISNYPFKEFDKKYKKNEAIILSKKQSFVLDSIQQSEISFKDRSEPIIMKEQLKKIQQDLLGLTRKLKKHESSYPFRTPVDPKALQIPDYFDVILEPIDLKTIQDKIRRDQYEHVGEFQRDIYKMIMNSYKYNQKASTTQKKTIQFEQFYVQTMKQFHNSKNGPQNGEKQIVVKEQMVDQRRQEDQIKKIEEQKVVQVPKQPTPPINPFVAAKTIKQQPKQNSKLFKVLTQMVNQRPKHAKKQIPKSSSVSNIPKSKSPKKVQTKVKKQQPEDDFSQVQFPMNELIFSQPIQPTQQKDLESEQIKQEMKSYLDNETQNNRQLNFSQGYNEAALGGRIKNIEVQKQITNLLKRLSEFPLTKQKKIKNLSKFTNLEQNMTQTDKKKLFDKIIKLDQNDIQYVVRILTKGKCETSKLEEFQIDLDKADSKVLREVQNFIALRDQTFASSNQPEVNGSMPLGFQPQPVSAQVSKIPKKTKKQQKKNMKKKMSRKNSNDDSFSLNPPPIKKKKSQKPHRKSLKNDQKSQNGNDQQSLNDEKEESSSYHPQPAHHQHHGKIHGSQFNQKSQQTQKINHVNEKIQSQNKKKTVMVPEQQKQKTPRPQYHETHLNHVSPHLYHNEDKFDDIDQFLAISRNSQNEIQQDMPFSYHRLRQPSASIEQLDFMEFNNFGFPRGNGKDYPEEEMKDFSIYQPQKEPNDEDHFF